MSAFVRATSYAPVARVRADTLRAPPSRTSCYLMVTIELLAAGQSILPTKWRCTTTT